MSLSWRLAAAAVAACIAGSTGANAAFPGSNGRLAFISDRTGSTQVFSMNSDGSGTAQLTDIPTAFPSAGAHAPRWSPDGRKIAFDVAQRTIYTADAGGTNPTALTATG